MRVWILDMRHTDFRKAYFEVVDWQRLSNVAFMIKSKIVGAEFAGVVAERN